MIIGADEPALGHCAASLPPRLAQQLRGDDRLRLQRHHVTQRHDHHRRPTTAGFGEQFLRIRHAVTLD